MKESNAEETRHDLLLQRRTSLCKIAKGKNLEVQRKEKINNKNMPRLSEFSIDNMTSSKKSQKNINKTGKGDKRVKSFHNIKGEVSNLECLNCKKDL